ncbi:MULTISPECIES: thymidine phosphorylase family protein [unclassified Wenzhouxiangella]|uniref:thymidine phosphorylase family protein n=1 Tax=unclassified Wenzhouxiangella TaxID=2613841 RepID=UPI000E327817|nr:MULTISPECIES: thymidine phosphorylase family protein [unclassified Wenzhouxiangella]RFF26794.1 thymidine phosphorylase family protein [Wenzhouxiangella sp. 15181]RFP67682.1 thymidine phosphorylase family protein [Wenzhouxiangella sp. 15190]
MRPRTDADEGNNLVARRLGLDTHDELVVITRRDCPICRSEGFSAHARVRLKNGRRSIIATLYQVDSTLLGLDELGLSESAWKRLEAEEGDFVHIAHPQPVASLSAVRGRVYGKRLDRAQMHAVINDIAAGRYADVHLAMFLTSVAARDPDDDELADMIAAMVDVGERLEWSRAIIVDKHCVGGLPGNRTTPLVVAIVAEHGLWMPKTSSRAITSPSGTADTVETMTPVDLDIRMLREVVQKEGGCMAWGGAMRLSPVDDTLIRVERLMDIDAEGQMVASVLSKKVAAGSTHLVLDVPVGETAKIRSQADAERLAARLETVGERFGIKVRVLLTDGRQPVGRGIGPALEAHDVLAVLANAEEQPRDLRERAVLLAGALLELAGVAEQGRGEIMAEETLASGRARARFEAICRAQGGLKRPPRAEYEHKMPARHTGVITRFDNRRLAQVAKLAGAPGAAAAGVFMHVRLGDRVEHGQPLYAIHAESNGELSYAREYAEHNGIVTISAKA